MSIASEIQRIKTNITNAYTACSNKNATLPTIRNSANLPACINSIPAGGSTPTGSITITQNGTYDVTDKASAVVNVAGGATTGDYTVYFIDYQGVTFAEKKANAGDIVTFPTPRTIPGMTFDCWTSPELITNNTITMPKHDVVVSPIYYTTSGKTEIDLYISEDAELAHIVKLNREVGVTITIDWGDGTSETDTCTSRGDIIFEHTYNSLGNYLVTIDCQQPHYFGAYFVGQLYNVLNTTVTSIRCSNYIVGTKSTSLSYLKCLKECSLSNSIIALASNIFSSCYILKSIILPTLGNGTSLSISSVAQNCYNAICINLPYNQKKWAGNNFYGCSMLKFAYFPEDSILTGGSYYRTAYSLEEAVLPESYTTVGTTLFYDCRALVRATFYGAITTIPAQVFYRCYNLEIVDLTHCTIVPTLANSNAFFELPSYSKIVVPDALYDSFIVASNWSTLAKYIISRTNFLAQGGMLK